MASADEPKPMWQEDEALRTLDARLAVSAARPRIISFGLFDTLLGRLCAEPADLFVEVGRQLGSRDLLRNATPPDAFRAIRSMAESKARDAASRSGKSREIKLADVYAELRAVVSDAVAASEVELSVERRLAFANPAMISLLEHVRGLGCRTAIVADTYLSAGQVLGLLADHGVPRSLFDGVLVSCERGKAKSPNGALYQELLRQFDVHPGEVLHIGDDLHADVYMARRLGIDTLHYDRFAPAPSSIFSGERQQRAAARALAGSLQAVRVMSARRADGPEDAYRDGALTLGPVLSRFADWCVAEYARAGVTRVLALMREGELLADLVRRAAAFAGVNLEIMTCYTSRMATARAAMAEVNAESAVALLEGGQQLTPQEILDILGLGDEASKFLDDQTRMKPLPSLEAAADFLRVLFRMPLIRDQIERHHRESRELAFAYLSTLVGDAARVGILDLGFSGSIQHNIARILRRGGRDVRTFGCYLACTPRAAKLALEGDEAHAYVTHDWNRIAVLPSVCLKGPSGSTRGYVRGASGRVEPVLESVTITDEQARLKRRLREGVLAFQHLWLTIRQRPAELALPGSVLEDIDRSSAAILYRWIDFPTQPEADRLGRLHHDESYFGRTRSGPLCDEESRKRFRHDGARAIFENPRCHWPQGVMAQIHPRAVSVLRHGSRNARDLGRLGALGAPHSEEAGLIDSEIDALEHWLAKFQPEQLVVCGRIAPALGAHIDRISKTVAKSAGAASAAGATGPVALPRADEFSRVIVASGEPLRANDGGSSRGAAMTSPKGAGPATTEEPAAESRVACVGGHFSDAATLRAIRAQLRPGANVALVLTDDVDDGDVEPLLCGLSPFLGGSGVILAGCGRFDRESETTSAERPSLKRWLASGGIDVGFALFPPTAAIDRSASRDWVVLWHSVEAADWRRQWMPIVADLAYELPTPTTTPVP